MKAVCRAVQCHEIRAHRWAVATKTENESQGVTIDAVSLLTPQTRRLRMASGTAKLAGQTWKHRVAATGEDTCLVL